MAHSDVRKLAGVLARTATAGASDPELLARYAADRDDEAFAELVRRHGPMVLGVCNRVVGDSTAAEDAFQATFLVLARRAGSVGRPELLANFLYGVARRVSLRARKQLIRRRMVERSVAVVPDVPGPAAPMADLRAVLDDEIARLPAHYRAVVVLCDLEDRPRRTTAEALGIPDSTLSNRLTRARALLGRRLLRRGVTLAGVAAADVPARLVSAAVAGGRGAVPASVLALITWEGTMMLPIRFGLLVAVGLAGAFVLAPASAPGPEIPKPAPAATAAEGKPEPADPIPIPGICARALIRTVTYTPDGTLIAVSEEYQPWAKDPLPAAARITFFDAKSYKPVRTLTHPEHVCGSFQFAPDGKTAYVRGSDRKTLSRVDVATWKVLNALTSDTGIIYSFRVSPDGKTLATNALAKPGPDEQRKVDFWDAATMTHLRTASFDLRLGFDVEFAPDGKAVGVPFYGHKESGESGGLVEFNVADATELRRLVLEAVLIRGRVGGDVLAYSPNGRHVAVGATCTDKFGQHLGGIWIWNRGASGRLMPTYVPQAGHQFKSLLFSADGTKLFVGGDGHTPRSKRTVNGPMTTTSVWFSSSVQCWDNAGTTIRWSADGDSSSVTAMTLSPDGTRLLVADFGGLWLFDTATGRRAGGLIANRQN